MPTYDYKCDACDHAFEEWQSFHDAELTKCPKCKKKKLRRLIGGGAAILFKGNGFYQTDYRSESYKTGAKADAPAPACGKEECAGGKCASTTPEPKPAKTKEKTKT